MVVELKRGTADRDVHLRAITYAALVSRFDLDALAQAHREFRKGRGEVLELDECRQRLLDHVDGEWSPELLQRPRQVIIAGGFPKQVTHTVVRLSEMNLDIDLIQVGLWKVDGQVLADLTKVYPTPEVEEFTLAPARIEAEAAAKKLEERSRSQNAVHVIVGAGLLPDGTLLTPTPRQGHHLVGRRHRPRPGHRRPRRVGNSGQDQPHRPGRAAQRHRQGLDERARPPGGGPLRLVDDTDVLPTEGIYCNAGAAARLGLYLITPRAVGRVVRSPDGALTPVPAA
ncbi:hypothetical protein [Streptomyces sp. NPDC090022]|uniref:hypothetical protein n=1 Tax=Streptomyces sp. NPDC090022 TaxID=3365920 RepID=UPI0037F3C3AB